MVPRHAVGRQPLSPNNAKIAANLDRSDKQQHPSEVTLRPVGSAKSRVHDNRETRKALNAPYNYPVSPSGRLQGENFFKMRARQRKNPYSPGGIYAPENMVFREQHPINAGRKGARCMGRARKLYSRFDYVGPIFDSMQLMYAAIGWISPPRETNVDVAPMFIVTAASPDVLCKGCGTTNRHDLMISEDRDTMVCRCGTVCNRIFKELRREKNCTEDEDKTTHADKIYEPEINRFDSRAPSANEARKMREQKARTSGGISKRLREKLGVGYAPEQLVRNAAQADRRRQACTPKEQTKEEQIYRHLDELFDDLGTVSKEVQKHVRIRTRTAWHVACEHRRICKAGKRCQLNLCEKGHPVIAESMFYCILQQLIHGKVEALKETPPSHMIILNDRFQAHIGQGGQPVAQRAVRAWCMRVLDHENHVNPIESCVPVQSSPDASPMVAKCEPAPLVRSNSNLEDVANSSSEIIQLRDSVNRIFVMMPELPEYVRQGALQALQSQEFRTSLNQARAGAMQSITQKVLAYVILESSRRACESSGYVMARMRAVPTRLLSTLGLTAPQIEEGVLAIQSFAPASVFKPVASDQDEDGLF